MTLTYLLALVPILQSPPVQGTAEGEVGKFHWPPAAAKTVSYTATLTKERKLPKDLAKRERAARKAAGLYAPSRPPKQSIEMGMSIELRTEAEKVEARYETRLRKQSLRLKIVKPKKSKGSEDQAVPFLSNDRIQWVWGLPASRGDENVKIPLAALERKIDYTFQRAKPRGTKPGDLRKQFGDHLLPVIWIHPLPCWIGEVVHTLDLDGEAVVEGKQLISDGTQFLALGNRRSRVVGTFTRASESGFTMEYKITAEQFVSQRRGGGRIEGRTTYWMFDVEGEARYSFREQAWDSIVEKITARPKDWDDAKLKSLYDEAFEGTIKIKRNGTSGKGKKRGRRRKR